MNWRLARLKRGGQGAPRPGVDWVIPRNRDFESFMPPGRVDNNKHPGNALGPRC
jgi:hypothetical protein